MKKLFTILSVSVLVWGCAKKIAPVKSEAPSSNIGSSSQNNSTPVTTTTSTTTTTTSNEPSNPLSPKALTPIDPSKLSPEDAAKVQGQLTFNAKCNKCHGYKPPSEYTDLRWVQIMTVMAIKANLTETEKSNVLAYVRANAKKG